MCGMCGQCCRMMHLHQEIHDRIQEKSKSPLYEFLVKNMEYIGPSNKVPGTLAKTWSGDESDIHIYKCKLITEDNKCSIHKNKPLMCSGYPWYGAGKRIDNGPWPYKGCSYERDYYELRMLKVLKNHLRKLQEDKIDSKRKNINSSQKGISGKRLRESIPA